MVDKMNVLIAGSRTIDKLPDSAIEKIDRVTDAHCIVLIGDSGGVEEQVQNYLSQKKYAKVIVYYAGGKIRINAGKWETRVISCAAAKDKALVNDADFGLLIWNGLSIGTLNIIKAMKTRNKGFHVVLDAIPYDEKSFDVFLNSYINR
jgi:succinyl-CoA synthetase alpha subunit